ncbi:MAG: DNA polymerase III subunit chi [Luminiphilus sp.]|nr:DNA polymerase III subunit chi [Luminiphilus sp.]
MTKIDFYVLPEDGSLPTAVAIGRLAEKASARGHQVFIQTKDSQDALQLDEALWAFRPSSFLPHSLATERGPERVIIGHEEPPMEYDDVLINLTHSVLGHFSRFERMAEIVTHDALAIEASREAWRFYRDRGYPLEKHELSAT